MLWSDLPAWDEIPIVPGMPKGCAWGLFDKDGKRDQLGTLNLITPETILEAKNEIQYGESVALKRVKTQVHWVPAAERKPFKHRIKSLQHLGYTAYDDEMKINTQSSSQWDGLRHWAHQQTGLHYNNVTHESILDPECADGSIHYWSSRGGIVGRGVLIDYHQWAKDKGLDHPVIERTAISTADIEEVARWQGVELRPADILIIRTGWIEWYNQASDQERSKGSTGDQHIGLEGNEQTVKWLWEKHFVAVASDTLAFEAWPTRPPYSLHDWLIALWGCPIGELWDLEALAAKCRSYKKWSFFIASAPLNVRGGVASPPNVVAIL